jgi:hypothetical protein
VDAEGYTSDKRISDNESSGFDSVDSSSVDTAPEATARDTDDEIPAKTETELDSLPNNDNEQLMIQTLNEEETVVRVNLVQSVQNDDCTFRERNRKFYAEKCMPLKGGNKDRHSTEKEGEHIARNVQIIHVNTPVNEKEVRALPEGNSGAILCPRYETEKTMALSLWDRNVMSAGTEYGRKRATVFPAHDQNILTASQKCEKNAVTGSRELYRHGTKVCCKYNKTGAAAAEHEDQEVAAVQAVVQEGDVSRKYEQPKIKELLPEENEINKDEKEKHNKEEQEKDALEVPESEEEERERTENEKADKGKNKENAVGQTPVHEKKRNEDKVRDNHFSLFNSASSSGQKRSKWNCGGHSKILQKKVADWQQFSLFGHPSENNQQPEAGKVRCSFQFTDICWSFEYLIVSGIKLQVKYVGFIRNLLTLKLILIYDLFNYTVNNSDYKACNHTTMIQQ